MKDYRSVTEQGSTPTIQKVRLRMHLENVVKDISVITDDSWTYSDILVSIYLYYTDLSVRVNPCFFNCLYYCFVLQEMESRIVKAMKPELCLDPSPKLDRLCTDPIPNKVNLFFICICVLLDLYIYK